ncbi:hypothetical protein V8E54_014398 [Elaphomyces granulatus]
MTSCAWVELKLGTNAHLGPPLTAGLQGPQSTLTTDLIPHDMWYVGGCSAKIPIAIIGLDEGAVVQREAESNLLQLESEAERGGWQLSSGLCCDPE